MNLYRILTRLWLTIQKSPELVRVLTVRGTPMRRRFRVFWQEVRKIAFGSPGWLSWQIDSLSDIRRKRCRSEQVGFVEKCHRLAHRLHSFQASLLLGGIVFAVLVASSAIWGAFQDADNTPHVVRMSSTVLTVAQLLGGLAGVLFAVIVFGIQFHGERLGQASYLTRYFIRREGLLPIASFSLAVVGANAVVGLLSADRSSYAAVLIGKLDYLLVPLVFFLLLVLIHRMIVSVSLDVFDSSVIPGLLWEYHRAVDEEVYHFHALKSFEQAVLAAGLRYGSGTGLLDLDSESVFKFPLSGDGVISDVNLEALSELGRYLDRQCPDFEGAFAIGPLESVQDMHAFVISRKRDDQMREVSSGNTPSKECLTWIDKKVHEVLRVSKARRRDVLDVLERFEQTIASQARFERPQQLERTLNALQKIIETRLSRKDLPESQHCIAREGLPESLEGHVYYDVTLNVISSGDKEKVLVWGLFLSRAVMTGVHKLQGALFARSLELLSYMYYRASCAESGIADLVGEKLDTWLSWLNDTFEYTRPDVWRYKKKRAEAQRGLLPLSLRWRLELMKTALDFNREDDAANFQDRLFEWDQHIKLRHHDPMSHLEVDSEVRYACDLSSIATLSVAAYCLRLFCINKDNKSIAAKVFHQCASDLGQRENVIRVWESAATHSLGRDSIFDQLGVTRWTDKPIGRIGKITTEFVSTEWIERGLVAVLLAASPTHPRLATKMLGGAPKSEPISPDRLKTLADSILDNDALRTEVLKVADVDRQKTNDEVQALVMRRMKEYKLEQLGSVIAKPISAEHSIRLKTKIISKLELRQGLARAIEMLGDVDRNANKPLVDRFTEEVLVQKQSVVDDDNGIDDLAWGLGKRLAKTEDLMILSGTWRNAKSTRHLDSREALRNEVEKAIKEVRQSPENVVFVFVPEEHQIWNAVFGREAGEVVENESFPEGPVRDWSGRSGCYVVPVSFARCSSVVVVDASAFYGRVTDGVGSRLELGIEDRFNDKHKEWLEASKGAENAGEVKSVGEVTVVVSIGFSPGVGLYDDTAAQRIDLDLKHFGYALKECEEVYHRPDCSLVAGCPDEFEYLPEKYLATDAEPRMPCETCDPQMWGIR